MDADHLLRDLFDKIDGIELAAMKDRREEESFNLDFKRMDPSGEPSEADKRNLRESISGFANSAGGIILWGVESKSGEDKRDRSRFQGIIPVTDGERAAVRFHELTATATQPAVSGVVHRAVPVKGGYVVKTFVPASDGGPHRTNEEKGQYFRRDAGAFRAMQHHEIADMFGRRARPQLELAWESLPVVFLEKGFDSYWVLGLRNVGRGLARFPSLLMKPRPNYGPLAHFGLTFDRTAGLPTKPVATERVQTQFFAGGGNDVVHPKEFLHITRIGWRADNVKPCIIDYQIFAEHMPTMSGVFTFSNSGISLGELPS